MKYMRQFCIILGVTCVGELFKTFIPLPIPGSIYGLILMLTCLITGIVKIESVKEAGEFLVEIMPLMFIPAGVGLMASWGQLAGMLMPVMIITVVSTIVVMVITGKTTDYLLSKKSGKEGRKDESDHS